MKLKHPIELSYEAASLIFNTVQYSKISPRQISLKLRSSVFVLDYLCYLYLLSSKNRAIYTTEEAVRRCSTK